MDILYFDCLAGVSGEMVVGAFLDMGISADYLLRELDKLPFGQGLRASVAKTSRQGIAATQFLLSAEEKISRYYESGPFLTVMDAVDTCLFRPGVKRTIRNTLLRLARAQARVHQLELEKLTVSELGGVNAVLYICAAAICLDAVGADLAVSSPVTEGLGVVESRHGILSVPVPTTLEIMREKGAPLQIAGENGELITPAGAAIICEFADRFDAMPDMTVSAVGFGAGMTELSGRANVLRLILGKTEARHFGGSVCIIETNVETTSECFYGFRPKGRKNRMYE